MLWQPRTASLRRARASLVPCFWRTSAWLSPPVRSTFTRRLRWCRRSLYVGPAPTDKWWVSTFLCVITHKRVDTAGLHSYWLYCAQASNVLAHASYSSSTMLNDVALLYFATPFTFTSDVGALPLPAQDTAFASGLTCNVSGWGTTSSGIRPPPEKIGVLRRYMITAARIRVLIVGPLFVSHCSQVYLVHNK